MIQHLFHKANLPKLAIATFIMISMSPAIAETPEEKGLRLIQEKDVHDSGFKDYKADLVMVLRNRHGQESKRQLRNRILEVQEDGDKLLIIFDHPKDVDGTAFLTFTHKTGDDDQWLYLPALKRVKRISANNRSSPFMGSEFSYEDLNSLEVERYTYKFLRDESLNGEDCYVVERYPNYAKSGYTKNIVWMDKAEYRIRKVEFYDRKDELLKTMTQTEYQEFLDQYWYPGKMEMINHQTGKSTVLDWSNYQFRNGLSDSDFNQRSLARAK